MAYCLYELSILLVHAAVTFLAVVEINPGVGAAVETGQQHDDGKHRT